MISINISELIWTVINFFLLYFLLKRFLFTPVIRFMDERKARVDAKLNRETQAKEELEKNEQQLLEAKEESRREAKHMLAEAGEEIDRRHSAAMQEAKATALQTLKDGETELAERKEKTAGKLREASPELAELLSGRLLQEK